METKKLIILLAAVTALAVCSAAAISATGGDDDKKETPADPGFLDVMGDLMVYGNANNDTVIDGKDLEYIEEAMAGEVPTTPFCDANHDGLVDKEDLAQVEDMLKRRDGTVVWFVDAMGDDMTVEWPLEKIIVLSNSPQLMALAVGLDDSKIIGYTKEDPVLYKSFEKAKVLKSSSLEDHDILLENGVPDAIILGNSQNGGLESLRNPAVTKVYRDLGIDLISVYGMEGRESASSALTLGYLVDTTETATRYYDWCLDLLDALESKVSKIPYGERKTALVWFGGFAAAGYDHDYTKAMELAGGRPVADWTGWKRLDEENSTWILKYDPDCIFRIWSLGYGADAQKGAAAFQKYEKVVEPMNAVKEGRFYLIDYSLPQTLRIAYMAEMMYPDLFGTGFGDGWHQKLVDIYGLDFKVDGQFAVTHEDVYGS